MRKMKKFIVLGLSVMLMVSSVATSATATSSEKQKPVSKIVGGEDTRPRAIITTDLECDDMNSLIHLCLFFNDVDVDGIVYSASQFHFVGDGVHTLGEITPDYLCEGDIFTNTQNAAAANHKVYRPMELGWIESLWKNEYAKAYKNLSKNDPDYPTPKYLTSITKVGNVEFEGDVRKDTEGSNLIKKAILDNDTRTLYLFSWGGFNTVARALLSISDEYKGTDQWDKIYKKVCDKVILSGVGQDTTFNNYIAKLYPDLKRMNTTGGYAGYFAANNAQADARYTFNSEWLTKNIKFNHGSLNGKYGLMGDGTYYKGELDSMQYGQMLTIDWGISFLPAMTFDKYDFLAEGDSGGFMALINVGLRGLENGNYGTWAGRLSYAAGVAETNWLAGSSSAKSEYNYVTGETGSINRYLLTYQKEWAARADWCVKDYNSSNHAPIVNAGSDIIVAPGSVVNLKGYISDPDGDSVTPYWWVDMGGSTYSGTSTGLQVWDPTTKTTKFTVPKDAKSGDSFCITLQVTDNAKAPMTRYAQVIVKVTEPKA